MPIPLNVLILQDQVSDAELMLEQLRCSGFDPAWERINTEAEYVTMLQRRWDVILADYAMPHLSGPRALELLRTRGLELPFIVISSTMDEEAAVSSIKQGASDYLRKDRLRNLGFSVSQSIAESRLRAEKRASEAALRESEERFRQLAGNIDQVFWLYDLDLNAILYVSPAFEGIWGRLRPAEGSPSSVWLATIHPDDRERMADSFCKVESDVSAGEEYRIIRPDGTVRWIHGRTFTVKSENAAVRRIAGVALDITERKNVEQDLSRKTTFLEAQIHSSRDGVLVMNGNGKRLMQNQKACDIWNAPAGMLDSMTDAEAIDWIAQQTTDPESFTQKVNLLNSDPDVVGDDEIEMRDGRTLERYSAPVVSMDGAFCGRIWTFHDLTNRKRTEQNLMDQAALIDEARDAILVLGLNHHIMFWSKGAERLYGWKSAEVLGVHVSKIVYRNENQFASAMQLIQEVGHWEGELQHVTREGAKLCVASRWTLMRDADGHPKSVLTINSDITERRKAEELCMRAQRMESIGTLAGGIAHDLNNVLTPILMGAYLLRAQNMEESSLHIIDLIEKSVNRGADLVRQVLSFARGDEGVKETVCLLDVVNEIECIVKSTFPKHIQFSAVIADDLWLITSDSTQMHQMFLNLCVNARDAMRDGGTLSIDVRNVTIDAQYAAFRPELTAGNYVRIIVADTGCGIPAEHLNKIFEPFFTTKSLGEGTGLGLATTIVIIKSNEGFIDVKSQPGRGTSFIVHLPVPAGNVYRSEPAISDETRICGLGECILIVDDEKAILSITAQTLETYGYRVLTAENGARAAGLFAAHVHEIDVVVIDMMMPVMGGAAAIMALREINPEVRIIAASGLKDKQGADEARRAGVEHFLRKPYSAVDLLSTIRDCVQWTRTIPRNNSRTSSVAVESR
ncbi:MAG: response regulator [Candidatus Methylacidiphilales bacterium]